MNHPIQQRHDSALWLSHRDRAILRAVAEGEGEGEGEGELTISCHPDLFIGGRYCSDQAAVHRLTRAGLITAATSAAPASVRKTGHRVPARLAPGCRQALGYDKQP